MARSVAFGLIVGSGGFTYTAAARVLTARSVPLLTRSAGGQSQLSWAGQMFASGVSGGAAMLHAQAQQDIEAFEFSGAGTYASSAAEGAAFGAAFGSALHLGAVGVRAAAPHLQASMRNAMLSAQLRFGDVNGAGMRAARESSGFVEGVRRGSIGQAGQVQQGTSASASPGSTGGAGQSGVGVSRTTRALSAGRQVEAAWGASTYRHGGLMTGVEHIMYRHSANSGFSNVSRFAHGTTVRNIKGYVDQALRYGQVTSTGPGAYMIEHSLGRTIGTNVAGEAARSIRVYVRDGIIQTAFPF